MAGFQDELEDPRDKIYLDAYGLGTGGENSGALSDPDRPTLGQRIGARPGQFTQQYNAADAAPPPAPKIDFDPSKMPDGLMPKMTPAQVPVPPSGSNNPNLTALAKEQGEFGKPLDPSDPKYKMGTGTRVLGTIANVLQGFGRKPFTPTYVGPGATNARFARDEEQREGNLANVNTQIGTQEKLDSENEKMYRDAIKQTYEGQVGEARLGTSRAQQETADTKAALAKTQADLNESRSNALDNKKPAEPKTEPEIALALQDAKLRGDKQAVLKYQGALDELRRIKAAGKDTSAADISKAIQVATYRTTETNKVQQEQTQEAERRYAELDKDITVKYDPAKKAAAKAKIDQELQTKYQPRIQDVNDQADKMLGLTKSGKALTSGAANQGKSVSLDEAKDYLKRAGGNKEKARQLAKKDGRTF